MLLLLKCIFTSKLILFIMLKEIEKQIPALPFNTDGKNYNSLFIKMEDKYIHYNHSVCKMNHLNKMI